MFVKLSVVIRCCRPSFAERNEKLLLSDLSTAQLLSYCCYAM